MPSAPSFTPPRLAERLSWVLTPAADRVAVLGDLAEEFAALAAAQGVADARAWYWRQTLASATSHLRRRLTARWRSDGTRAHPASNSAGAPLSAAKGRMMASLFQDLRFGVRMLASRPLVTIVAVLSLVVGLGGALVVFILFNAVLLRPLPVSEPDMLAVVLEQRDSGLNHNFSYQDYLDFGAARQSFVDVVAYGAVQSTLGGRDGAEIVSGEIVSGNFFTMLGVRMRQGRGLVPADDDSRAAPVVVVSESFWRHIADAGAPIAGSSVVLNGVRFAIVGVAAAPFRGMQIGRDARFWSPLHQQPVLQPTEVGDLLTRNSSWLTVMGRLRPDVSRALAADELTRVEASLPKTAARPRTRRFVVEEGRRGDSMLPTTVASPLQLLLGASALVLLVACANVAGLLMARAGERQRELAVRAALGATRVRLWRLLGSEALILGLGSTAIALGVASVLAESLVPLIVSDGNAATLDLTPDWRTWGFAAGCGVVATLLFGIAPVASALPRMMAPALVAGGRTSSSGRAQSRLRQGLVVTQFALALALMAVAVLLGRTLLNLKALPTGFDLDRLVAVEVDPQAPRAQSGPRNRAADQARITQFVDDGLVRLAAIPGVQAVGFSRVLPLDFGGSRMSIEVAGYTPAADEDMEINYDRVTPGYFQALELAPRDGRVLDASDIRGAPLAAVVNETMARRYWSGQRAVGQSFATSPTSRYAVVGVVPDVKYRMVRETPGPSFYVATAQHPASAGAFYVRTAVVPDAMMPAIRAAVASLDPAIPITRMRTLREQADLNVNDERLALAIALGLSFAAVLLAAAGLYAAMSHAVGRRTREIGVRLALGAVPADVGRLVLSEGLRLAIGGSVAGLALAIAAGHLVRARLFGVTATDPASLTIAIGALTVIAAVATWAPARRAARVDPVEALRAE